MPGSHPTKKLIALAGMRLGYWGFSQPRRLTVQPGVRTQSEKSLSLFPWTSPQRGPCSICCPSSPILLRQKHLPSSASPGATSCLCFSLFGQTKRGAHTRPQPSTPCRSSRGTFSALPNTLSTATGEQILSRFLVLLPEALHTDKHILFLLILGFCISYLVDLLFHLF